MVVLVSCFFLQTAFVYRDPSDATPLSPQAAEGRRIWQEQNCQSCHQFYGYGGFLGPDLTNASPRLTPERLQAVVTRGVGVMPPFPLSSDDIEALGEFLAAMNDTGQGQAKLRPLDAEDDPMGRAYALIEEDLARTGDAEDQQSYEVYWESGCDFCHEPFRESLVGAPDITGVLDRLSVQDVERMMVEGSGEMPPAEISADARASVINYLGWLGERRAELVAQWDAPPVGGKVIWSELPWWEYR